MVLQIRGANGSGKSTVVKRIIDKLGIKRIFREEGRRQPLYYQLKHKTPVFVLGHYATQCGGCDTIIGNQKVFELQRDLSKKGVVIAEGIMLSEDLKWSSQLKDLVVLFLNTNLEECLERVQKRRIETGNTKPFNQTRTIRRYNDFLRIQRRLNEVQIICRLVTPEQAEKAILNHLGVKYAKDI